MIFIFVCVILVKSQRYGRLVKRLRRRPLTAKTGVRFPYRLFIKNKIKKHLIFTLVYDILIKSQRHGRLVKRLRRRPLTAKTGVRFPYRLFILERFVCLDRPFLFNKRKCLLLLNRIFFLVIL